MRFLDEYRDADGARLLAREIARVTSRPWTLMEVCGGQTHSIVKFGLDELLPPHVSLLHGPGCPVCVTPVDIIDKALEIASRPEVIFCSFGDMLRVPGTDRDLLCVRPPAGTCGSSIHRSTASKSRRRTLKKRSCFSELGSRPRRRQPR